MTAIDVSSAIMVAKHCADRTPEPSDPAAWRKRGRVGRPPPRGERVVGRTRPSVYDGIDASSADGLGRLRDLGRGMDRAAYDNVRGQIGACGIWCGSCAVGNGALRQVTRSYIEVLEGHGLGSWAPSELNYDRFRRGLSIVAEIATCPGCRQGGGREACEMKSCASDLGYERCTGCPSFDACPHGAVRDHMRNGALAAALLVMDKPGDPAAWIERHESTLRCRFPASILFSNGEEGAR